MRRALHDLKTALFYSARSVGLYELVRDSRWRQRRLLILAYHGVAVDDEDQWRPDLYMPARRFESRLEKLRGGNYTVLPLRDAIAALRAGELPPRSVALTFDDGTYDFYCRTLPLLQAYGYPATVYLTTYYAQYNRPIFELVCSYMLWKCGRAAQTPPTLTLATITGSERTFSLTTSEGRAAAFKALITFTRGEKISGQEKNELAARLAKLIGLDYDELCARRILHLMNSREVEEVSRAGIDIQLHTHRHKCPHTRDAFVRELHENRLCIERMTNSTASHFCYPCGRYQPYFLPWLEHEQVESATTCDPGLASSRTSPLLLPRFVDTQNVSDVRFEAWLSGLAAWVPGRRTAEGAS